MPRASKYDFIDTDELPEEVYEELIDCIVRNDSGTIVNPDYHPKLKQWLVDKGWAVRPYILWASW